MRVFDTVQSDDASAQRRDERIYAFLRRSNRSSASKIRDLIEAWFARYPEDGKSELKRRLESGDADFERAFYELYLHALFTRLGYDLTPHPEIEGQTTHPDYLVSRDGEDQFYLEAIVPARSDTESGTRARIEQVYAALDGIDASGFTIWITSITGAPEVAPPTKPLRRRLVRWLADLDPDVVSQMYEESGELPSMLWEFDGGWEIQIRAIPKSAEARGKLGARSVGVVMGQVEFGSTHERLRSAILQKASKYGTLPLPYVIAVNLTDPMDHIGDDDWIDVQNALLGDERTVVSMMTDGTTRSLSGRADNGAWIGPGGGRKIQVSGLLLSCQLGPWSVASQAPVLLHHPAAALPIPIGILPLQEAILDLGQLWDEVRVLSTPFEVGLFGLGEGWPRN